MIPQRLRLSGFLSYREPQVLDFGAARLWLLAGANGSGKSAVFDAITWALYGIHRAGSLNAVELIHKSADRCDVEYDFAIGDVSFRIERSLKRSRSGASGTQAILRRTGVEWVLEPETSRKEGFNDWIARRVGLSFEAFTSCVLLRQGQAEKLLDAAPKSRAETLASVVRLERYQRLHERANTERLKHKAVLDALDVQREGVLVADEAEVGAAAEKRAAAETAVERVRADLVAAEEQLAVAHQYRALNERLAAARRDYAGAQALQAEAQTVHSEHARLLELTEVVPIAETVVVTQAKRKESEHRTERFTKQQTLTQQQRDRLQHVMNTAKAQRQELAKTLTADEAKLTAADQRLRALASTLQTIRLTEEQAAEVVRLDAMLLNLPRELPRLLTAAQAELERLQTLGQRLPRWQQALLQQQEVAEARSRQAAATAACERIRREGEAARGRHEALLTELHQAEAQLGERDQVRTDTEVQQKIAAAALQSVNDLSGQSQCAACGQTIAESHRCAEAARRSATLMESEARLAAATLSVATIREVIEDLRRQESESNEVLLDLRRDYKEQAALQAVAAREIERGAASGDEPIDVDALIGHQSDYEGLPAARLRAQQLQDQDASRRALEQQRMQTASSLARLKAQLPAGDPSGWREEQQAHQAEEATLTAAVKAGKRALESADRDLDRLGRDSHAALTELTDLTARLRGEDDTRKHCTEIIERAMARLAPDWQMRVESAGLADYNSWRDAERDLRAARVPERFRELQSKPWHQREEEVRRIEAEVNAVPLHERTEPDQVTTRLTELRLELQIQQADAANWRALVRQHQQQAESRAKIDDQARQAQREWSRWKRLAELLGRDGLQRHLVRHAETAIVSAANRVLAQLSSTELVLSLADAGEAEKSLDLTARVGGMVIDASFLSGSQRFRVAIALALGLGEMASLRASACLMIDEGFGSLDRDGRAAMIRELHSFAERLPRILVVSHDEDFAAAFAHSYRFKLIDGATRVNLG